MSWYGFFKSSALEPNWWQNFYDHLCKAMPFIFNWENASPRYNTSGCDGLRKIWFSFTVLHGQTPYNASIRFEFSGDVKTVWKNMQGQETWQNGIAQNIQPHDGTELIKINWSVLKNMHLGVQSAEAVRQGFILANNATPVSILTEIKNAILQDANGNGGGGGGGDDGPDEPPVNSPTPGRRRRQLQPFNSEQREPIRPRVGLR